MGFNKQLPKWEGTTVEPPESKKEEGYIAGDRPPASWENWLRNSTYEALKELQEKSALDSEFTSHKADITSEGGRHGIRYFEDELQIKVEGEWQDVQTGSPFPIGNVSNIEASPSDQTVTLKWKDPSDVKVMDTNDNEILIAKYAGTMVRYSTAGYPSTPSDGDLVVDSTIKNQYETEGFEHTGLANDIVHYYSFFPYTEDGIFTIDEANRISAEPTEFDFGPGSTELQQGDTTAGWFGEVTTTEFGADHAEIASLLGLSAGTLQNQTEPFLKFIHDGKIKFIPKKSVRNNVSWNAINTALGGSAGGAPAEKIITVGDYQYKARFMRGAGRVIEQANGELYTDSYDDADRASIWEGVNGNWNANSENEWNTLILPLHTDSDGGGANKDNFSSPAYAPDNVPDWASYTDEQLNVVGDGRAVWCAETRDTNTASRVYRGPGSSLLFANTSSNAFANLGARLVLELL